MDAGRELDVLVAQHVMGWDAADMRLLGDLRDVPHYSIDIAAAWEVAKWTVDLIAKRFDVEKHRGKMFVTFGCEYQIPDDLRDARYFAEFRWRRIRPSKGESWMSFGNSMPHATCKAAMRVIGIDVYKLVHQ